MNIINVLLFILSLGSYYFAPIEFNYPFIVFIFILFSFDGYLSIRKDIKERFFFSFNVLYLVSFFLVCFAYPVFIHGTTLKIIFMDVVNPKYISKATALCQLAFSSFVLGMTLRKNIKNKNAHITNKVFRINYLTIPLLGLASLIIGVLLVVSSGGEIINFNVGWSATFYLLFVIYSIVITFYSGKNGVYTKRYYLFSIIFITGFVLLFIIGDRGLILNIVLALLGVYTFYIKRFNFYKVLALLFIGVFSLSIIAEFRSKEGGVLGNLNEIKKTEASSNWDYLNDLTSISRNIYEGYEYKQTHGYFIPGRAFLVLISPIPLLPRISTELFFTNSGASSTSGVISSYTFSKAGIQEDGGLGTNSVIDIYMSWGVLGVIVINIIFGYIVAKSRLLMYNNLYYAMIYFTLLSFAIYIPRATIYEPYRLIIWLLILTYLLRKKTFKISAL